MKHTRLNISSKNRKLTWPNGKSFAFSIFDDTDNATVENIRLVYNFLSNLGIRTTKSVWPLESDSREASWAQSLEDAEYLEYIKELQTKGFEIAFHGARAGDNPREVTLQALEVFREKIGYDPQTFAHHDRNFENMYWGSARCNSNLIKPFVRKFSKQNTFYGDEKNSPYFWGDICADRIKYVRNYAFALPNIRKNDPYTPYFDPDRPLVQSWFSTSFGLTPHNAFDFLSKKRIKRWESDNALVFIQVHFGQGFVKNGCLTKEFQDGFCNLVASNGWFAPVAEILDYVAQKRGVHTLSNREAIQLERRWARDMGFKIVREKYVKRFQNVFIKKSKEYNL